MDALGIPASPHPHLDRGVYVGTRHPPVVHSCTTLPNPDVPPIYTRTNFCIVETHSTQRVVPEVDFLA